MCDCFRASVVSASKKFSCDFLKCPDFSFSNPVHVMCVYSEGCHRL